MKSICSFSIVFFPNTEVGIVVLSKWYNLKISSIEIFLLVIRVFWSFAHHLLLNFLPVIKFYSFGALYFKILSFEIWKPSCFARLSLDHSRNWVLTSGEVFCCASSLSLYHSFHFRFTPAIVFDEFNAQPVKLSFKRFHFLCRLEARKKRPFGPTLNVIFLCRFSFLSFYVIVYSILIFEIV